MIDKAALRKEMTQRRAGVHGRVDPAQALKTLWEVLESVEGPISFYWPIRSEIDPRPVMDELAKNRAICLPVTVGYAPLKFRTWVPGANMETDPFGVSVPSKPDEVTPRTLVIPLLAFSLTGHRLGYGAGHYDRTLAELRERGQVTAIGFAYEAQLVEELPVENTDEPLDMIITERMIRRFPQGRPLASRHGDE